MEVWGWMWGVLQRDTVARGRDKVSAKRSYLRASYWC